MDQMHKIEVFFQEDKNDSESNAVRKDILSDLGIQLNSLKIVQCYYINADLSDEELQKTASKLLADPIVQKYVINSESEIKADWLIEVKLNSGVTDNTGNAAMLGVKDLLKREFKEETNENIRTTKKYFISGEITREQAERIAKELLANEVVENFKVDDLNERRN